MGKGDRRPARNASACLAGGWQAGKPCFNRQIGLCPGVCTGEISKKDYQKQIRKLSLFLSGKKKDLIKSLKVEMNNLAKEHQILNAHMGYFG